MTRVLEAALLLAPLLAYLLWRILVARGAANPSRNTMILLAAVLLVLGSGLIWMSSSERHAGSTRYVPAQLENGRIVPGHGA